MRAAKALLLASLWAAGLGAAMSCDPSVIAPLPSPSDPDDDRIITSSLGLDAAPGTDTLVAVVGFDGAVAASANVEITNARTGRTETVTASAGGSFSGGAYGRPDDILEVRQLGKDGQRSRPALFEVDTFVEPAAEVSQDKTNEYPAAPGQGTDASFGGTPEPDSDGAAPDRLAVVWSFEGGQLTVDAAAGFTTPGAIVIVTNTVLGAVVAVPANDAGGVRLSITANVGDEMLMLTRSSQNPALTSPAIRFLVPEAGASGGTDAPKTP